MKNMLYPDNWRVLAAEIKDANHWQCQECQRQCRRPGEMWIGWEYELTVAHYDQCYEEDAVFLACLCVACHFAHDARHSWQARLRWRRFRQWQAGQLKIDTI
jgi:hypothetical protein